MGKLWNIKKTPTLTTPFQVLSTSFAIAIICSTFTQLAYCSNNILHEIDMNSNRVVLSPKLPKIEESSEDASTGENSTEEVLKRSKRFIYYNIDSSLDVGFLLTIPFTIVLPPMTNLFNSWRMAKRSVRSIDEDLDSYNYEDHPVIQAKIDKLKTYFEMIKIPEAHCIQRAICEFSSDPDKYFPISDMVLSHVQDPGILSYMEESENELNTKNSTSLYKLLNSAAETGITHGHSHCHQVYRNQCPFSIEERLNMPVLKFWKSLNSLIGIKFHEDW